VNPFPELEIRVPATTANLGAGYDLLGAALKLYNTFIFKPQSALEIFASGPFADQLGFPLNHENRVYQAFASVFQRLGLAIPLFQLELQVQIPPARGLGSSSTAVIAGLLAANAWAGSPFSRHEILEQAIAWEGHPDNVAPALLGGCILNIQTPQNYFSAPLDIPKNLDWVVLYPAFELETQKARAVVPDSFSKADCIRNTSFLAALVAGFAQNNDQLIALGLNDCLHQPYRQVLVPGMPEVMQAGREAGALGVVLSGAGPSLLALTRQNSEEIAKVMQAQWNQLGISCDYVIAAIDAEGALVLY